MMKMPWVTPGARMEVEADRLVLHTLPANTQIEATHHGGHKQHLSLGSAMWLVPRWRNTPLPTLAVEGGEEVAVVHVLHHQEQVAGREVDERAAVAANWIKDEVVCGGGVVSATPQCKSQCSPHPPTHPPALCTLSHVFPKWRLHVHTNLKNWILSPVMTPLSSVPISYWQYTSSRAPVCRGGGGRQRTTKTT